MEKGSGLRSNSISRWVHVGLVGGLLLLVGHQVYRYTSRAAAGGAEGDIASELSASELGELALAAFRDESWDEAARLYRQVTEREPENVSAWVRLAYALHVADRIDEAIPIHMKVCEFPRARSWGLYHLACAYALQDERQLALDYLYEAIYAGYRRDDSIADDPDLACLHGDPLFEELVELARPLDHRTPNRQFDFWIGDWDMIDSTGRSVGWLTLSRQPDGHLLTGEYEMEDGAAGSVLAYYDPGDDKWVQTWIGANGSIAHHTGQFRSTRIEMRGEYKGPDGTIGWSRIRFRPANTGEVYTSVERSTDGRSWETVFQGAYEMRADVASVEETERVQEPEG